MTALPDATLPVVRAIPGPGSYMCGLGAGDGRLWHSDQEQLRIYALDPASGAVLHSVECRWVRADLTYHDRIVYQVGGRPKRLVMVEPTSGEIVGQRPVLPASGRLTGVEVGPEGVWMCLRAPTVVQLRDLPTMTVQREHEVPGLPSGLTCADGVVVYADFEGGMVRAVDPGTGALLAAAFVEGHPTGLAWDGDLLWYCDFSTRTVKAVRLAELLAAGAGRPTA